MAISKEKREDDLNDNGTVRAIEIEPISVIGRELL
jgi:hypothetical protein